MCAFFRKIWNCKDAPSVFLQKMEELNAEIDIFDGKNTGCDEILNWGLFTETLESASNLFGF